MPISKEMMIAAAKAYHSVAFGLHPHALRAALESALSAAEPLAWLVKRYDLKGVLLDTELSFVRPTIRSTCRTDMVPLYAAPPAPSVAMESLELDANDPQARVLAVEAAAKAICQRAGTDPADAIMMLMTAAAHLYTVYSGKPSSENIPHLAHSLVCATVAADDFFKLKPAPVQSEER